MERSTAKARRVTAAVMALGLSAAPLIAGPIILAGHDADDHGFQAVYADLFDAILANVSNGQDGILAVGADPATTAGNWIVSVSGLMTTPQTVTFVNGAAIATVDFSTFAIIHVPSDSGDVGGGITQAETTTFAGRAFDVADFINDGGGLFGLTAGEFTDAYGYLGQFAMVSSIPVPPSGDCGGGQLYDNISPTPQGMALGITETNIDGCCWHNVFDSFAPFLNVLANANEPGCPNINGIPSVIGCLNCSLAGQCSIVPVLDFNAPGGSHLVTATLLQSTGSMDRIVGATVDFSVISGPNAGQMASDVTDIDGMATFKISSNGVVGVDVITASFVDPNTQQTVNCNQVVKFWDEDCQPNNVPDTCDISCAGFGADQCIVFAGCGQSQDANQDGVPDECGGACCDDSTGVCTENVSEADCLAAGNRYGGDGSTCSTIFPPCEAPAACCLPSGACVTVAPFECVNTLGGIPLAPGTACTAPQGCCFTNGNCQTLDPLCCLDQGGTPQGPGTACTATQAACFPDRTCADLDSLCADDQGAMPQGPGTACSPEEACCTPDGSCQDLDPLCCLESGGTPAGSGTTCAGGPSPESPAGQPAPGGTQRGREPARRDQSAPAALAPDGDTEKESLISPAAKAIAQQRRAAGGPITCSGNAAALLFPLDGSYTLVDFFADGATGSGPAQGADQHNDDDSATVPLGFTFDLYGSTFTTAFVNNNGNLSFGTFFSSFTSSGFPVSGFPMVAPFWADVDTGNPANAIGDAWQKIYDSNADTLPDTLIVTWEEVGYYNEHTDLRNTFQVAISDGSNPSMGIGNNICFAWDNMCWTTGDASGGSGGFGGTAATVGANRGNGVEFFQIGRFDHSGADYDGPFANNDGVDFLDFSSTCFSAATATGNIAPLPSGFPPGNKFTVDSGAGQSLNVSLSFLAPEAGQTVTVVFNDMNGAQAAGLIISYAAGNVANIDLDWTPDCGDAGSYTLQMTASDDFSPPGQTVVLVEINILACAVGDEACCLPDRTCDDVHPVCCALSGGTPQGSGTACTAPEGCCLPDGTCQTLDPLCCLDQGGLPQGAGTACTAAEGCCFTNGTCQTLDPLCCLDQGGLPQGAGTACTAAEGCCFTNGTCQTLDPLCCLDQGGLPQGAGTACTAAEGCCFTNGTCQTLDPLCCLDQGGLPQGSGTACTAAEGCCLPDGTCQTLDPLCCLDQGGAPQGSGTACTAPEGCCLPDGTCQTLDPLCCLYQAGVPQGAGTACSAPESCCFPNGTCEMLDPLCCLDEGGTPTGGVCTAAESCCFTDGTCEDLDPECCTLQGGTSTGGSCTAPETCCLPDGTCTTLDPECCANQGGTIKPGQSCTALQSCCFEDSCLDLDPLCCLDQGGTPLGPGTVCDPPLACCAGGTCVEIDPQCCRHRNGSVAESSSCLGDIDGDGLDDACGFTIAIPAVTRVGMALLLVLLGTGLAWAFRRRAA